MHIPQHNGDIQCQLAKSQVTVQVTWKVTHSVSKDMCVNTELSNKFSSNNLKFLK